MVGALKKELEDLCSCSSYNEESSFSAELHIVQSGTHASANVSSTSIPWAIHSGATEHMIGMEHLCTSFSKPKSY